MLGWWHLNLTPQLTIPMSTPLVSIVVTAYNKAPYLKQSVDSVLAQTYPNIECIIINDGSTDNTEEIAQEIVKQNPQIQYYAKPNGGISSARNFGNTKAKGEWIQFLDADDWIHEDKIRFQLECLQEFDQEEVLAYGDYERVYVDDNNQIVKRIPHQIGKLSKQELVDRLLICPDFLADSPFPLLQQAMLFKKSIFDKRKFDTKLKACEDRAFVLDLLMEGFPYVYTPMITAYYRKHADNLTDNDLLMRESYVGYFEVVKQSHGDAINLNQASLSLLVNKTMELREGKLLARTMKLVNFPVYIFGNKLKVSNPLLLKLVYSIRLALPSFLLYEKYRGARTKKVFSAFSKLLPES